MKRSIDHCALLTHLGTGEPMHAIAKVFGYENRRGLRRALRDRGITRLWTPDFIPVVQVERKRRATP